MLQIRKLAVLKVPDEVTNEEIVDSILKDNLTQPTDTIDIITRITNTTTRTSTLILSTSSQDILTNTLKSGYVYTNFLRLKVEEGNYARLCHNCGSFHHSTNRCTSTPACLKCSGNHKTSECSKDQNTKCINCTKAKMQNNNHQAISKACPIFKIYNAQLKSSIKNE